ncbi:APC family permease [Geodermatophilus sp. SYSU D01119]
MTIDARTQQHEGPLPVRTPQAGALRAGALGVVGMAVMVVGATAPLTAMASNISLSLAFGPGPGTIGVLVLVVAVLVVFTAGYVTLSRAVVNTGAYYAYVAHGLGRTAGAATASIATIAYNAATAGMAAATGYFADLGLAAYAGIDLPWWLLAALALTLTGALGLVGVSSAARATTVICAVQFALLAAFVVAVLLRRPEGFTAAPLAPSVVFSGGIGLALVTVLLAFSGYEATAAYCEEARDARRTVARATYLALLALGGVFLAATWAVTAAVPDVQELARQDPGGLVFGLFATYLGTWTGPVLAFVVAGSFLGATVAFHNMATRYLFALGRSGLLASGLARTHPRRRTPHVAVLTQLAVSAVLVTPFAVAGIDPLTGMFPAISGINSLAVVVLMTACCASVVVAASRGRVTGSRWATRIAPVVSGLALLGAGVLIVANYEGVTGSAAVWINVLPAVLVVGAAFGAWRQRRLGAPEPDVEVAP